MTSVNTARTATTQSIITTDLVPKTSPRGRELAWLVQADYFYEITSQTTKEAEAQKKQTSSSFLMRKVLKECGSGENNLLAGQFTKFLDGQITTKTCNATIEECITATLNLIKLQGGRESEKFLKSGLADEISKEASEGLKKSFQSYATSRTSFVVALNQVLSNSGIIPELIKIISSYTIEFKQCFPKVYQLTKDVFDNCYPFTCQTITDKAIGLLPTTNQNTRMVQKSKISIRLEGLFQSDTFVTFSALKGKKITVETIKTLRTNFLSKEVWCADSFEFTDAAIRELQEPIWKSPKVLQIEAYKKAGQLTRRLGFIHLGG